MKHILSFLFIVSLSTSLLLAQNEADALRHSQTGLVGSARALGMGGAFSAVGADISSGYLNPAGLGLLRSSKFTVSPVFRVNTDNAEFLGNSENNSRSRLNMNNWGYVVNKKLYYDTGSERREVERGLKAWTFGIGQHQLENYYRNTQTGGFNEFSSISQALAANAQGINPANLGDFSNERLAFDTFIIDTVLNRGGDAYFGAMNRGQIDQRFQRIETGRRNEWFISLAGNFEDKLYIGGTVGIQRLEYSQRFNVQEIDVNNLYEFYDPDPDNGFPLEIASQEIRFSEWFGTFGSGINAKLGVIFRPTDPLRIGVTFHSPSYFSLTDTFNSQLVHVTQVETGTEELSSPSLTPGRFEYNLTTPYKITAGFMYLLGKSGFISGDVDYIDYSFSNLSSNGNLGSPDFYSFEQENENVNTLYQAALNFRVGGEYRYDIFRLRAGYSYFGSPYSTEGSVYQDPNNPETLLNIDGSRNFITLGVGIRQPNYFIDVAYVNQQSQDKFSPYTANDPSIFSPTVVSNNLQHHTTLTVGFNF
ncbi:MAG: outer membrane protein transport protein [Bacteroidota bacterium]